MADSVAAFTGLGPEEAANFLEMAGGNVEAAVALFFDMQGGGGGGAFGGDAGNAAVPGTPASPVHAVLFGSATAPSSWVDQGFEFCADSQSRCCLIQHKNGPCGVLAVVNAEVLALMGRPLPSASVDDGVLCAAFGAILWRCATAGQITLARWAESPGGDVVGEEPFVADGPAAVAARLLPVLPSWKQRGGCCLLCYSAVLTRGIDKVKTDVALDAGSPPLVVGPHSLCSTELMTLLMAGVARGNVGAYSMAGGKVDWRTAGSVGLLSRDELEGMPLADALKSPSSPVYVLHGGDHFTVCCELHSLHSLPSQPSFTAFPSLPASRIPPSRPPRRPPGCR